MDTMIERTDFSYLDTPPVLIGASDDAALERAKRTIESAGAWIGAATGLGSICDRIEQQPRTSAVWIELDRDCGTDMDRVLECVSIGAQAGRFAAIVSTTADLIDAVYARGNMAVEVVVDADDAERHAALALARARSAMPLGLSDVASDRSAERLRQLSDEVSRIAATLARLSSNPPVSAPAPELPRAGSVPQVSAETVRAVIRARRLRSRYFPEHLFADPAWDMMLDLLQAEIAQLRVPVSSLCIAAAVPATTALRWLKALVQEGLFLRRADPHDGRRVFVELAPATSEALRRYFSETGSTAVI